MESLKQDIKGRRDEAVKELIHTRKVGIYEMNVVYLMITDCLFGGKTYTKLAEEVGRSTKTLLRWRNRPFYQLIVNFMIENWELNKEVDKANQYDQ